MTTIDIDALIRDRAYEIWEKAGRPQGREHEHWARARVEIEAEVAALPSEAKPAEEEVRAEATVGTGEPAEIARLRRALYDPEPFSFELFGNECPKIDHPIIRRPSAAETPARESRRAA
ncbi:hypothetical protein GCM10011390_06720 [Aureimonas endophytica]|uniref:DUF2934 family protein n=1 Tax=Aureimonas endophytica TaxID=2027858 RepID=A0A916ZDT4_9HYPH|nr:DUF2934 domain-containing protein [Aureimonas endophytica]GGD90623.1 hypothetical protein GCM10011390_06720 [Aureimonas endophytica]